MATNQKIDRTINQLLRKIPPRFPEKFQRPNMPTTEPVTGKVKVIIELAAKTNLAQPSDPREVSICVFVLSLADPLFYNRNMQFRQITPNDVLVRDLFGNFTTPPPSNQNEEYLMCYCADRLFLFVISSVYS